MGNIIDSVVDCILDNLEFCCNNCTKECSQCQEDCIKRREEALKFQQATPRNHQMVNNIPKIVEESNKFWNDVRDSSRDNHLNEDMINPLDNDLNSTDSLSDYSSDLSDSASDFEVKGDWIVYVLQLVEGHYYVGKTKDMARRYREHASGTASNWTKKYPPVKILEQIPNKDGFDEDAYTKRYMTKYGIDRVRGASYCQIKLSNEIKLMIKNEIYGAEDHCYRCGQKGHYANACDS